MMAKNKRSMMSAVALVLLAVLFVTLSILSSAFLKGMRIDLTEDGMYTLSEGTLNILKNMDEPVNLYLYFSEDISRDLPQFRSYARWAGEMLEEFADRSEGKLSLHRVNPEPFSIEEDQAAQYGLQGVPVGAAGDTLYFGLVATNSLDGLQMMPFLQPEKEKFLEYDLAKMVSSLSHPEQKKVGLISGLSMQAAWDPATQSMREAWVIHQQLGQLFDLQDISADASELPDDLDLLLLVHPKDINEDLLYQIDQFVLTGGHLLAFLDPLAESDQGGGPSDPTARLSAGGSSSLQPLLEAWGVGFDTARVIGDRVYALQVGMGPGQPAIRHLGILSIKSDGLNATDVVSADLEVINFSSAGWLLPLENATSEFEPLVQTSENAAPIDAARIRFMTNPQELEDGFQATGDRYALVARITGDVKTAFPRVPEGQSTDSQSTDSHVTDSSPGGINVVLFADTDVLTDRLWIQKQDFLGQVLANSFADNGTLVANIADQLLGSQDLIGIRARGNSNRSFKRVDALRLSAESQFRETEQRLQQELDETERTLTEMQAARDDNELTVLNAEQQVELQRFLDRKLKIRTELRQVQHDLSRGIEALGMRLKFINIVLVPVLTVIAALVFGQRRRKQRERGGQ